MSLVRVQFGEPFEIQALRFFRKAFLFLLVIMGGIRMKKILFLFCMLYFLSNSFVNAQYINIVDMPILWNDKRAALTKEYSMLHYKKSITEIVPQAVVIHWTASSSWKSAYIWTLSAR